MLQVALPNQTVDMLTFRLVTLPPYKKKKNLTITSRMQQLIQPMNVFSPADSSCTVICISTISHLQTVGKGDVFIILEVSTVIKVSLLSLTNCGFKWPSLKQFTINPSNSKVPDFHSQ